MARVKKTIEELSRQIADRVFPHFTDSDRRDALEEGLAELGRAIAAQSVEIAVRSSSEVFDARVAASRRLG